MRTLNYRDPTFKEIELLVELLYHDPNGRRILNKMSYSIFVPEYTDRFKFVAMTLYEKGLRAGYGPNGTRRLNWDLVHDKRVFKLFSNWNEHLV